MTGRQADARILTPFIQTGRVIRTVAVLPTFRLRVIDNRLFFGSAGDQRVAHPSWRTHALGIVVLYATGGGRRAWVVVHTRIETSVVNTGRVE